MLRRLLPFSAAVAMAIAPAPAGASTIGVLQQIAPAAFTYAPGIDFLTFGPDALVGTGDVTAALQLAGTGTVADFAGFPVGRIALVVRDPILTFGDKLINAANAGAAAVLIYNNVASPPLPPAVQFIVPTTIPALFITQALGQNLLTLSGVQMRVAVSVVTDAAPDPVPEPATVLLFGSGLVLAARRRVARRRRSNLRPGRSA